MFSSIELAVDRWSNEGIRVSGLHTITEEGHDKPKPSVCQIRDMGAYVWVCDGAGGVVVTEYDHIEF